MTQSLCNVILIAGAVSGTVMTDRGLDFYRCFPLHRRLIGAMDLRHDGRRYAGHFRRTFGKLRQKHDFHCGVLQNIR